MAMTSVTLKPGVNTMMTPSQNEAGVSQSQLVRYQQGMIQKYGGWTSYYPVSIGSTIRELWGWQAVSGNKYLGIGATQTLSVLVSGANTDITPESATTNGAVFSVSSGSNLVTIVDANTSASVFTTIVLQTPVNVGGIVLNGTYPVNSALTSSSYTILSSVAASTTTTSSGILPILTTVANSGSVGVTLPNNNLVIGSATNFLAPTTVGGLTISGPYSVTSLTDSTTFNIGATVQSSANATATMNNNQARITYYYQIGPPSFLGYGLGGYGLGGYGTGVAAPVGTAPDITATDWTMANWGEILVACPFNGPIFTWPPQGGFQNAGIIPNAPLVNGGIFISQPQQILVAWASTPALDGFGWTQNPLLVKWSDSLNFNQWTPTSQNSAGSFQLPTGSIIKGGIQTAQQGILWTDIDCYTMQFIGQPLVFGFSRVGSGCGLVGMHAMGNLNGNVYWMGPNNFFVLNANGVTPLPCPVWNFVFQSIDTSNLRKVRCAVNSLFNEIVWFFPESGTGGNTENSLYVKYNIIEGEWDCGSLGRSAWIDATVLGNPIGSDIQAAMIYQHEVGYNAGAVNMDSSFQSGYWTIAEGNEMAIVDWILPDMTFMDYGGASASAALSITFFATDYTGDSPRIYGPFPFVAGTEYINTRIRGRFMAMKVEGLDANSFWRIGRVRYRYAPDGRR
jgi:hypothetical protein